MYYIGSLFTLVNIYPTPLKADIAKMNQNQNPAEILNWEIENIIDADTFEYLDKKHYQKTPPTLNINIPYS